MQRVYFQVSFFLRGQVFQVSGIQESGFEGFRFSGIMFSGVRCFSAHVSHVFQESGFTGVWFISCLVFFQMLGFSGVWLFQAFKDSFFSM